MSRKKKEVGPWTVGKIVFAESGLACTVINGVDGNILAAFQIKREAVEQVCDYCPNEIAWYCLRFIQTDFHEFEVQIPGFISDHYFAPAQKGRY